MGGGHLPGPLGPAVAHAHPGRRHLTIDHLRTTREVVGEGRGDPRFDLQVGTGPAYALTIQAAAIQTDAELGGLPSPG